MQTSAKQKLILVLVGTFLGVILCEGTLRLFSSFNKGYEFDDVSDLRQSIESPSKKTRRTTLKDIIMPNSDDRIIYDLKPNLDLEFQKARVKTNSFGMRGREVSTEKPEGVFRIAVLGDSFAFGWGVEGDEAFPSVLERSLNRVSGGNPVFEVLNFGIPGYSTFQEVQKFLVDGRCFNVDAVLIYFVSNDFGMPFFMRDFSKGNNSLIPAPFFVELAKSALNPEYHQEKMRFWKLDPVASLQNMLDFLKQDNLPVYLVINPRKDQAKDLQRLWPLKKRTDIKIINLYPPLQKVIKRRKLKPGDLKLSDDPHPSALRHELLGEILSVYFMKYVQ